MSTAVVVWVMYQMPIALVAQKAFVISLVQNLEHSPFRFASRAKIFLSLIIRHSVSLNRLINQVDSPFDRIDRRTVVDIIVGSINWSLLAFFDLWA